MADTIKVNNIFEHIPLQLSEEIFEPIIDTDKIKIERILSKGHSSPKQGWYKQDHDEWVVVLRGSATIECEHAKSLQLDEGSYINIPAGTKHKVIWTHPDVETLWLAVHY